MGKTWLPYSTFGEDYCVYFDNRDVSIWENAGIAEAMADNGCNTVRLGFAFDDMKSDNPTNIGTYHTCSVYDKAKIKQLLGILDGYGMKAILVLQNGEGATVNDGYDYFGSQNWVDNWKRATQDFLGDDRVAAFELFGEATEHGEGNFVWNARYGGRYPVIGSVGEVQSLPKMHEAMAYCIDKIRAIDPSRTIVYPCFYAMGHTYWYGYPFDWNKFYNELKVAGILNKGNIVYDILHPYYFENQNDGGQSPEERVKDFSDKCLAPCAQLFGGSNCWIGETYSWKGKTESLQTRFLSSMIDACIKYGIGVCVWVYWIKKDLQNMALSASGYYDTIGAEPPEPEPDPDTKKSGMGLLLGVLVLLVVSLAHPGGD